MNRVAHSQSVFTAKQRRAHFLLGVSIVANAAKHALEMSITPTM